VTRARLRPAWAEIDLGALTANARALRELVAPALLCAVVKADGYGHGAVAAARAALRGGAEWLAVALVEEGVELREAGIGAPILVLSEPSADAVADALAHDLRLTVYTPDTVRALQAAVVAGVKGADREGGVPVHLKVDTGMHRVGAGASEVADVAALVAERAGLRLEALWTHLAVADEPDNPYTAQQLAAFAAARGALERRGMRPVMLHAANSAGAILHPGARFDMVRCGISLYGYAPAAGLVLPEELKLTPALSLRAEVTMVRRLGAGERLSYGLRYSLPADAVVATVPLGYADGVSRALSARGAEVLIGGRRRRIAGTVTMDQLMVDCGPDADVHVGDEVVLIGSQGDQTISAEDWAGRLDTISYEVLCGVGPRVDRRYTGC